jgi:nucleotide-binding universal stress UspA family protein
LDWLRRLCGTGPCEVTVAYAAYPPQESWRLGIGEHAWLDALPLEIQRLVQRDIEERVSEALDGASFKVRVEPAWGRADPLLLSLAKEAGADLIVVGTHQRNGFGRFWLGSVSRAILRDSMCSVAIVPRSPARAEGIQSIPTIRRVLVPTDFSDLGNRAIRHAYSLLPDGGTVFLVHVNTPGAVNGSAHARLRALVPPDSDAHGIATIVDVAESDRPAEAICQAAERFGADVVCIASHGRTGMSKMFMGSVAQEVISRTSRLLLIVRAP